MGAVTVAARLVLAAVFVVAGLAKLADLAGSRRALAGFGLPGALAAPLGLLLPLVELAVAVALLPVAWAWYGALGALALLVLFVAAIAVNMALGKHPDCHCFGQIHSEPAGWSTLARNLVLAAAAGLVVWQDPEGVGPSAVAWLGLLTTAQQVGLALGLVGLGVIALQAALLLQLLRQQGRLLLRLDALEQRLAPTPGAIPAPQAPAAGLPVGAPAPAFRLDGLRGETLTLDALLAGGKPVVLFFTHPQCGPCQGLLPDIGRWQREHAGQLTIALLSEGSKEDNRAKAAEHGLSQVLLQQAREVADAYQAYGTPAAVLVRPDGSIGSPLALGADAVRALVAQALRQPAPLLPAGNGRQHEHPAIPLQPVGPTIGDRAPEIKLPDLDGNEVTLARFRGSQVLVLFWNPGCGFCQQMLADLKAWAEQPPKGAPRLLVVSTGDVEANRAMGLKAPVLLDQSFQVGSKFGANGTPMAVLVDAQGRIASEVAAGAPAVWALAGASPSAA